MSCLRHRKVYRAVPVSNCRVSSFCRVNFYENSQTFQKHRLAAHETRNRRTAQSAQHPVFVCGGLPKIVRIQCIGYRSYLGLHAPRS